ncbi:MAG: tetratricopeptide repeat protein [Cyanobacteria bacterium REEB67]|nr:tetratricopeptide repeat protein [Cyanobacteria bacterium REEB67]
MCRLLPAVVGVCAQITMLLAIGIGAAIADETTAASPDKLTGQSIENIAIAGAKQALASKQYAKAFSILNDAIDRLPMSARLHLWLGNTYWSVNDYRSAVKEFDTAIGQNDPTFDAADASAHKGVCLARLGMYDQAVRTFRQAAREKTSDPTVTLLIGRALFEDNDYKASVDYLKNFETTLDPNIQTEVRTTLLLTRAEAQAGAGHSESALANLEAMLAADPKLQSALIARARIYQKLGLYDKAVADAQKAVELRRGRLPLAHMIIGECQLALKKIGEAELELNIALQEYGRTPSGEIQYYKALVLERKGDFLGSLPGKAAALQLGYMEPPAVTTLNREVLSVDKIFNLFSSVLVGDHFLCYGTFEKSKLTEYSRLAEAFAGYANSEVCPIQGDYPAFLFMLQDKAATQSFLRERMDFHTRVHGVFMTNRNAVITYNNVAVGTFLHELMHKFIYIEKPHDFWADEGIPSFFEKAYGYLSEGKLHLQTGYAAPTHEVWGQISRKPYKLSEIVTQAKYADPEHEDTQRLVALFLNEQAKLKAFLDLTLKGQRGKYEYFIEAVFDKPLNELDPLFDNFQRQLLKNRETTGKLPGSEIFASKDLLDKFLKKHNLVDQ